MRNQNRKAQSNARNTDAGNRPNWVVKAPTGTGDKQRLERIGAAWDREDGGVCVRLIGTQVVSQDLYIYPIETDEGDAR